MPEVTMKFLNVTANIAGFGEPRGIPEIIGTVISAFLSLLGVIFLCLIIYGGYMYMTSMGNEDKVLRAKKIIQDAVIGLIIILGAYGITRFVITAVTSATYN